MNGSEDGSIELTRRIHLGRTLGEGGMGRVVDGFAPDLGQHLAVKSLLPEHADNPELVARFKEEVAIMASIDHPGNLPVFGITTDPDGNPSYVMKKVEGETFEKHLAEGVDNVASLPRRQKLLSILLDACETVGSAHSRGIVHRDLKPDNILIDREGSVFVIDWGIARRHPSTRSDGQRTLTGQIMGTPGYMSPEQADGRADSAGPASDVFALGGMLYEILTGRRPFDENCGDRAEMLAAIHRDPDPPRRANWLIPRSINAVCLKALHKDPSHRYANARLLADDLRAHLELRSVSAIRPNLPERLRYAARRQPLKALSIAGLLFVVATLTAFIGTQKWIDHQLAEKAMKRIEGIDSELAELEGEAQALLRRLDDSGLDDIERRRLEFELGQTESRWLLDEIEAVRMLSSVADLRFIKVDSEIRPLARKRLKTVINRAIDRDQSAFAHAILTTVIERHEEGENTLELSEEELVRLKDLADQIETAATQPAK